MLFEEKMGKYLKRSISTSTSTSNQTTTQLKVTQTITTSETKAFIGRYEDHLLPEHFCYHQHQHNNKETIIKEKESIKELFSRKETVIIKSLIYFNKSNTQPNQQNFHMRKLNYSNTRDHQTNEHQLFEAIDRIVRKKVEKQEKSDLLPKPLTLLSVPLSNNSATMNTVKDDNNRNYNRNIKYKVDELICTLKRNNKSLEFIAIKCIIISLMNIINEWMAQRNTLSFYGETSYFDSGIFCEIYEQFLLMCKICPILEQDFNESFQCFKNKYEIVFTLQELLCDLFWDYIFKLRYINCLFVDSFKSDDIQDESQVAMKEIIQILWMIELPLMKNIGEILEMTAITNEKSFLATKIIEYKTQLIYNTSKKINLSEISYENVIKRKIHMTVQEKMNTVKINMETQTMTKAEIEGDAPEEEEEDGDVEVDLDVDETELDLEIEGDEDIDLDDQLQQEIAIEKHLEHEHRLMLEQKYNKQMQEEEEEQIEALKILSQSESQTIALPSLEPSIQPKESYNLLQKAQQHQQQQQMHNNEKETNTINTNKFKTNEEVYNDIVDNSNHKTTKRRNKKRKKRKNTYNNNDDNNDTNNNNNEGDNQHNNNNIFKHTSNVEFDQIIDQFHLDIYTKSNKSCQIQKIRPNISTEWLKSISSHST